MRRIGIVWPILNVMRTQEFTTTRQGASTMRNPCLGRYNLTRFKRKHILCGLFRAQTEQVNVSMNCVGKLNGSIIPSRKYLKRCLSVCLISVLQCSINFLVPLSVAGYTVPRVLCFQFCQRTVPEVRVRQPMSTLFQ